MSDQQAQPSTDQTATPPAGQEPSGNQGAEQQQNQPTGQNFKTPEWYEAELAKTRSEAANYRTKLRDAEARLAQAKTLEEYQQATEELKAQNARLAREALVAKVGKDLPDDLLAVLASSDAKTEEELKAKAEVLKKYVTPQVAPPEKLAGGLNPNQEPDDFDPAEIARKARYRQL